MINNFHLLKEIKYGLITRRLPKFETELSETICVELTVSKKNDAYSLHIDLPRIIT